MIPYINGNVNGTFAFSYFEDFVVNSHFKDHKQSRIINKFTEVIIIYCLFGE